MKLSALTLDREVEALATSRLFGEEITVRPEDTLRATGISSKRHEVSAADVEPPGRALVMAAAKLADGMEHSVSGEPPA